LIYPLGTTGLLAKGRFADMSLPRILHKFASPFLYKSGLYQQLWRVRSRNKPFSFVVIYHRIVADNPASGDRFEIEKGISATDFEQQMCFLLRHFTPVSASRIQSSLSKEIQFAVTLDDGYEDNYLVAAPILKKLGIPATFYVVSDFVGTDRLFWWEQVAELMRRNNKPELDMQAVIPGLYQTDGLTNVFPLRSHDERDYAYEQLCAHIRKGPHVDIPLHIKHLADYFDVPVREQGRHYGLMNWQQLNDLVRQGFEIGGHSASHCNVVGADETLLQRELVASVNIIEARIDAPVESFAYPYGMFEASSKVVTSMLDSTNCKAAFTTVQGVVSAGLPAYELPRTQLNRSYHFACAFNLQDTLNNGLPII
jgi:peptidoglycan/xylan/chitin deacetylase (PgdA/CDA1 family)